MDRRQLLANAAAVGVTLPAIQITEAIFSFGRADAAVPPTVWDLQPGASLPESYEGAMDEAEKQRILKECANSKKVACFPILEGDIPKTHRYFQSYSLFLISSPEWLGPDSTDQIASLYKAYEAFARAIGNDHAAVFFWKKSPKKIDGKLVGADLAANIDANRCAEYEKAFKLDISQSPHVVVTKTRPSPAGSLTDFIILQLNGLSPSSTEKFLTTLADQLVGDKLDQEKLGSDRWWLTWRDVVVKVYQGVSGLAGHSKVTIKGGPVELEVNGEK
jgi:hypothetical protein